jgi:hypothetical protein
MPFQWEQLAAAAIQAGSQARAASQVSSAQRAQLGAQFDALAGQAANQILAISKRVPFTQRDLEEAVALYSQLASIDAQYGGSVPYIREQWLSTPYKPNFDAWLNDLSNKVTVSASSGSSVTTDPVTGAQITAQPLAGINPLYLLAGLGLVGFLLLRR